MHAYHLAHAYPTAATFSIINPSDLLLHFSSNKDSTTYLCLNVITSVYEMCLPKKWEITERKCIWTLCTLLAFQLLQSVVEHVHIIFIFYFKLLFDFCLYVSLWTFAFTLSQKNPWTLPTYITFPFLVTAFMLHHTHHRSFPPFRFLPTDLGVYNPKYCS